LEEPEAIHARFALHTLHSLSTTPSAQPAARRARVTSQDPIWQWPPNPTSPSMPLVANAYRRTPELGRGVGSTPGCPTSPTSLPPPPLCNPTLPRDQRDPSAALSRRSDVVPCTPRAPGSSPAFPAGRDRDRVVPCVYQQGTVTLSPRDNPSEP
jgi:hypothetical protein